MHKIYIVDMLSINSTVCKLCEKIYESSQRAVVVTDSENVEKLCNDMWTYRSASFIPHGTKLDGMHKDQPIWITNILELDNNPDIIISTVIDPYTGVNRPKIFVLYDGEESLMNSLQDCICWKAEGKQWVQKGLNT